MKHILTFILIITSFISFSQEKDKALLLAAKKANNYIYEGNKLINGEDFVLAEMAYRKAISEQPTAVIGSYNLGTSYIKSGKFNEAIYWLEQSTKVANTKTEKHKAFHNIGNILMQNKKCKEAVEAYKSALRNNPSDDETRYNLGVAKVCAEEQQKQEDQNKDDKKDKDKKDEEKENKENEDKKDKDKNSEDKDQDKKEEDKKEGEDEKDEDGKPKDEDEKPDKEKEKDDKGKADKDKEEKKKPQPQPGQLSPQQIKSLLEAMNNQEQKVQEKMNAEKQKGVRIKTDKDW